jgi:hypothetical protein
VPHIVVPLWLFLSLDPLCVSLIIFVKAWFVLSMMILLVIPYAHLSECWDTWWSCLCHPTWLTLHAYLKLVILLANSPLHTLLVEW